MDEVDLRVIAALIADPRASWPAVARAVNVSEATVSRRAARILSSGLVHVAATLDVLATGRGVPVFVRVRCEPRRTVSVANALTGWPSVRFVSLVSGAADCLVELVAADRSDLLDLTLLRLPELDGVVGSSSEIVLRRFTTGVGWDPGLLDPAAVTALRAGRLDRWDRAHPTELVPPLSDVDELLVAALAEDGRMRWRDLAARVGTMESTARRRVENLCRSGALRLRTIVEPETLGLPVTAFLWLRVDPHRVDAVAGELARHPAVLLLCATAGEHTICGEVAVAEYSDLHGFLTGTLGAIPGIRDVDVTMGLQTLKRASIVSPWFPQPPPSPF
ncbi:Lrp/AsnC family transcriptional regulator [Streptosporangium sp. NPDC048047]|uniref:Lrp/AsnC family transcriptional regulator n=1 Tax=Streptosporangium sp. NPDC048047 TaxID=3155748 RepID=UPI0034418766